MLKFFRNPFQQDIEVNEKDEKHPISALNIVNQFNHKIIRKKSADHDQIMPFFNFRSLEIYNGPDQAKDKNGSNPPNPANPKPSQSTNSSIINQLRKSSLKLDFSNCRSLQAAPSGQSFATIPNLKTITEFQTLATKEDAQPAKTIKSEPNQNLAHKITPQSAKPNRVIEEFTQIIENVKTGPSQNEVQKHSSSTQAQSSLDQAQTQLKTTLTNTDTARLDTYCNQCPDLSSNPQMIEGAKGIKTGAKDNQPALENQSSQTAMAGEGKGTTAHVKFRADVLCTEGKSTHPQQKQRQLVRPFSSKPTQRTSGGTDQLSWMFHQNMKKMFYQKFKNEQINVN